MARDPHADHGPLRVVVAGAGIAGLELLVALRAMTTDELDVHIVAPEDHFSLRALTVFEPFGMGHPKRYLLAEVAADLRATFHHDAVHRVDRDGRQLLLQSGATLSYDELVLAVGALPHPAFACGVVFDRATEADAFDEILVDLRAQLAERVAVVVPPGATWTLPAYELALLIAADVGAAHVTLVTAEPDPLGAFGAPASELVSSELRAAGVDLVRGVRADVRGHTVMQLDARRRLLADRIVHLPLLAGPRLRGVPTDARGFILTDDDFRVADDRHVHAVGDGIAYPYKQGGLAAQQADAVAGQIAVRVGARRRVEPFAPVLRGLLRTAHGPRYLRAAPPGGAGDCQVSEQCLWWPPTKVASRWLIPWLATRDLEPRPTPPTRVLPGGGISRVSSRR